MLNKKQLICDKCYSENEMDLNLSIIPLDERYNLHLYTFFVEDVRINYNAFNMEYSWLVNKLLNKEPILYDQIVIDTTTLLKLSKISQILEEDVYVIAFSSRS